MTLMPRRRVVTVGDRFASASPPGFTWRVTGLTADHDGHPHVQMEREDDRTVTMTISVAALCSGHFYTWLDTR